MKPTIGRIVIYNTRGDDRIVLNRSGYEAKQLPAIITSVHSDTCINVQVIADGRDNLWITSTQLRGTYGEEQIEGTWEWPQISK